MGPEGTRRVEEVKRDGLDPEAAGGFVISSRIRWQTTSSEKLCSDEHDLR